MRLRIRFIFQIIRSFFSKKLAPDDRGQSFLTFRVLPTDCVLKYMGNDRHHAFMDCGRIDLMLQYLKLSEVIRYKICPFVYTVDILYSEPIRLFSRFTLVSTLVDWDKHFFWIEHHFVQQGRVVATAISKNGIKYQGRVIPPTDLLAEVTQGSAVAEKRAHRGPIVNGMVQFLKKRIREVNQQLAAWLNESV